MGWYVWAVTERRSDDTWGAIETFGVTHSGAILRAKLDFETRRAWDTPKIPQSHSVLWICDFLVPPPWQHRGLGGTMLNVLDEVGDTLNVRIIAGHLGPRDADHHEDLRRFYARRGYRVTQGAIQKTRSPLLLPGPNNRS